MNVKASTLLAALLLSTILITLISVGVLAQQEMEPEWVIDNGNQFTKIAAAEDGEYFAVATNDTSRLYVFRGNEVLWSSPVNRINSLAMSANGMYIAVGAENRFYFFGLQNSTPQLECPLDYENSLVALSADGQIAIVGTSQHIGIGDAETKLYLFEKERAEFVWNATLLGFLESLSMSDDGNYFVASTSEPGVLYLFMRDNVTPLWTYYFGEKGGGAKISSDGNYVVAVGGNQSGNGLRVFRFLRQTSHPGYIKMISELPSSSRLCVSANGSVFAVGYGESDRLVVFNLDLPPYGYGPGSVLNVSLPATPVSMSMSSDGRYFFVGTVEGIFVYEYLNRQLLLTKQYAMGKPLIEDLVCSRDGRYVLAVVSALVRGSRRSAVYLFDSFRGLETGFVSLLFQFGPVIVVAIVLAAVVFIVVRRKHWFRKK